MELCKRFLEVQSQIKSLEATKLELEREMYKAHQEEIKRVGVGTANIIDGEYLLKVVTKVNYKVDQDMADKIGGLAFRRKYELDKKEFDRMNEVDRKLVESALTVSLAKPHFSVVVGEYI